MNIHNEHPPLSPCDHDECPITHCVKDPAYIPEALGQQPVGLRVIPKSQSGPLVKMVGRMMKGKIRGLKKGPTVSQDVKIKHRKIRYW